METVGGPRRQEAHRVEFLPDELAAEVPAGTTILDAARSAGVFIDTFCGGEGICGKCRAIVRKGTAEGGESPFLDAAEIKAGYVLACQARVVGPLTIEVPDEARVRGTVVSFDPADRAGVRNASTRSKPAARDPRGARGGLDGAPPARAFTRADLERTKLALAKTAGDGQIEAGLEVIRRIPDAIRAGNHRVTVTLARHAGWREITDVVPGDAAGGLALAVDVGTTSVVASLLDLASGAKLGSASKYNSQAVYGPDVIHRILWTDNHPGGLRQLQEHIVDDVNALIGELTTRLRVGADRIDVAVAAGNTVMTHLLLAVKPAWIRRDPYIGGVYQPPSVRASDLGLAIAPAGLVYSLPCVSAYVGADITAGVLATGLAESEAPRMLVDLGTNGEIVIGNREWMMCASASAGPAFEGAGTRHGMRAMSGAVDHVTGRHGNAFDYTVIGDAPPAGLCGTAYIDLLAVLLDLGIIDKTGRFNAAKAGAGLRQGPDGLAEFVIVPAGERGATHDIVISQPDVENLLRAKGAVYAAVKMMLKSLGMAPADLGEIMVAGAFGSHLDMDKAVAIGLLPDIDRGKLRFAGNTSLAGAELCAVDRTCYEDTRRFADGMTYLELSTIPSFMEEFTSACFLPHTNLEEFPSAGRKSGGGR
mgnify:CR=1 FL=1